MKDLKILYYSNAFISNHGGRLHSEAFLKEAGRNEKVSVIKPYPTPKKIKNSWDSNSSFIRKYLKKNSLLQILFFYRRNSKSYKDICEVLNFSKEKFNVLHIRLDSNFLIIAKLKKQFPHLIISTEVNASPFDENFKNIAFIGYFKNLEKRALKNADANFFVSGFLMKKIMDSSVDKRDHVVHNGVDLEIFQPKEKSLIAKQKLVFGYVGTIDYHKNLTKLIDAFELVSRESDENISLLIIGDGPMFEDLVDYIKMKDLENNIILKGWVKHKDIVEHLYSMDIAIHHSANPYMSPLKLFEYMAVGLPVIGPDIPAVKEIFKDGEDIILVDDDTTSLSVKMKYLIKNETVREKIAKAGKQKIRSGYGWDSNAGIILNVLQEKINENN